MKFNNRGLLVLLCVLGVAIVGLTAGIILMGGKKAEEETEVSEDQISTEEYIAYVEDYYTVRDRVSELLVSGSVSADEIIEIYSEYIDTNLSSGNTEQANSYILARHEDLLRGDFKREALDVLVAMDLTFLSEPEQYRWYFNIIALAEELGEVDIVQKYEQLLQVVKPAYDASQAASEATAEEFKELIQMVEEDNE